MTDIVERLRRDLASGLSASIGDTKEAVDEIERLRAALLDAEMRAEIAGVIAHVATAKGRREGIEAAAKAGEGIIAHYSLAAAEEFADAIRALLEEGER